MNYDNFSCEICKDHLPTSFQIDGKNYNFLSEKGTSEYPYLILEGIQNEKSSTQNNLSIRIIFRDKKPVILGRGHDTDIRLEDVSISRQHCMIKFSNGKF